MRAPRRAVSQREGAGTPIYGQQPDSRGRVHALDLGDVVDVPGRARDPCSSVGGGLVAGVLTDLLEEGLDLGRSLLRGCEDEGGPLAGGRGGHVGGEAHRSILRLSSGGRTGPCARG